MRLSCLLPLSPLAIRSRPSSLSVCKKHAPQIFPPQCKLSPSHFIAMLSSVGYFYPGKKSSDCPPYLCLSELYICPQIPTFQRKQWENIVNTNKLHHNFLWHEAITSILVPRAIPRITFPHLFLVNTFSFPVPLSLRFSNHPHTLGGNL